MTKKVCFLHNNIERVYFYDDEYFKITTDNLALANFINIKKRDKILVEFGSGIGIVPLLLSCKTNIKMYGIEKDEKACFLAEKTIKENKLVDIIKIINDDVNFLDKYFDINSVDVVVCNPPYFNSFNEYFVSDKIYLKNAKHEISLTLDNVANMAKRILKDRGRLYLIHRVERLFEIRNILKKNCFAIKKIQFIHDNSLSNSKLVLIEATKNGSEYGLKVLSPIILRKEVDG